MKAALRDAKRAEATRDRPKGSAAWAAGLGRREQHEAKCVTCGSPMSDPSGRAHGGLCVGCMAKARHARREVVEQRQQFRANLTKDRVQRDRDEHAGAV